MKLRHGSIAVVEGLTGAVELNGAEVSCEVWDTEKGRWNVMFEGGEVKALKPDNLRLLTQPEQAKARELSDQKLAVWAADTLEKVGSDVSRLSEQDRLAVPADFEGYKFSGELRPAHVTAQMKPPANCSLPDYALDPEGRPFSESKAGRAIPVVAGADLETMRKVCRLGREVLDIAARFMKAGVTGDQIDRVVWKACEERQLYPSPLNYCGFPKSLCVSPNEVICHGIPDCRPIKEGDIVNLDISVYYQGFHSDLNETFFIGQCDEESHTLVRAAYDALRVCCQMIRPGTFYRDLGDAIHAVSVKNGCTVVPAFCGHGVGKLFHGPPDVPHYRRNKAVGIMKPGHIFTVEPMLNLGASGKEDIWPDDWTAVSRSGRRSSQFEHTFLVTEEGVEVLTARRGEDRFSMPEFNAADFQR